MKAFRSILRALLCLACIGSAAVHAGTISGKVTDSLDQVVAGVKVCALQRSFALQIVPTPGGSFMVVGCAETGADGRYSLALAAASSYLVQIDEEHPQTSVLNLIPEYHTGDAVAVRLPSQIPLIPVGAEATVTVNFKLERGYRFSGRIRQRDATGPIADVLVCLMNTSTPAKTPYRCFPSDSNGEYRTLPLAPGLYKLFTYNDVGYVDVFNGDKIVFDPRSFTWTESLPLQASDTSQDFYLAKGHTIAGTVRDFTNLPVTAARVCLVYVPQMDPVIFGCTQTANGYFETPPLLSGNYLLYVPSTESVIGTFNNGAVYAANALRQVRPLVLQTSLTNFDLGADAPIHFSGTVTRSNGEPVSGATVCFHRRHGRQYFYDLHDCVAADTQGHYQSKAMAAGYYGVTAGMGLVQHVAYDGSRVPLAGISAVDNPFIATTDVTLDLSYTISATERTAYLAENIAEFREPSDWPGQWRLTSLEQLALILQESILLADEFSAMSDSEVTSTAALDAAEAVGAAFEAGVGSLLQFNRDPATVDAVLAALARLVRRLDMQESDPNVIYSQHARLRALTLSVLQSAETLRFVQTDAEALEPTSAALAEFLNSVLSQGIQFDWEFIAAFSEFSATTGRTTTNFARDLLVARGVPWGGLDEIPADLAAVPLALEAYLRATALPLDFPRQARRSLATGSVSPAVDLALKDYFDATADSLDRILAIRDSAAPAQPLTVVREALTSAGMTHLQAQDANGQVNLVTSQGVIPIVAARVLLVSNLTPNGVVMLPDGSALAVHERVAVQVVPAPVNAGSVGNLLSALGEFVLGSDGSVRFRQDGKAISATLNFQKVASTEGATGPAQIERPADLASLAPDAVFRIRYSNGTTQTLAPFVSAPDFFISLSEMGLSYQVNRVTGVIAINGRSYRPAFIVDAPNATDLAFHAQAAGAQGIAYKAGDFNGDGKTDYKVVTAASVQVVYGL